MNIDSILFAGVGGDGIITASNVAAEAFILAGFDVKKSEIHGMSQRGGSVSASVRFGEKVYSPTDKLGSVSFVIATEKIEALRCVKYLHKDSIMIINDRIMPIINQEINEAEIDAMIKSINIQTIHIDNFLEFAKKLNNEKVINTIMLGVLANYLPIDNKYFHKAIENIIPSKIKAVNIAAFNEGLSIGK